MNVLVYSGSDTAPTSLAHTFASLRTLLAPNYAVQPIDQKVLHTQPWAASCALLVFPPFPPSSAISPFAPAARAEIQKYVEGGGRLLALGASVRVAARRGRGTGSVSALSAQLASVGISAPEVSPAPEKLTLEDSDGQGLTLSLVPSSRSEEEAEADATSIRLADGTQLEGVLRAGVVDILQTETSSRRVEPLAHYVSTDRSEVAAIRASVGLGAVAFWTAHVEAPVAGDSAQEKIRVQALRTALESLGLRLPEHASEELGVVPRPTPQILTGAPWRTGVIDTINRALGVPDLASAAPYMFKDRNDSFLLHPQGAAARVFAEQREAVKMLNEDPATWNPKHIVVYGDEATPLKDLTPKFDIGTYYEELKTARDERGCRENYRDGTWGIGEALLYGEIVTSTQTMLDKNTRLLTALPTPLLSLASTQLTGRGRGANVWLSPPGCLMFSLLLRVPLAVLPAQKLVFIQYLFALAVVEACRADGVLCDEAGSHVRIKWPNDIYAITRDGERKKVGGILVNTSFEAGKVEVVIGCGLNVLNAPPILSLAQLLPNEHAPPTMERTVAAIMARFERMWADFLYTRGSFEPFVDLYLERWLHSDQEVTLTTVMPPRKVRTIGITPDHGLLRTLPEAGQDGGMEYVDLQPDGNSFDLLAGLIKTKDQETRPSPSCWIMHDSFSIRHSIVLHPVLPIDVFEEIMNQASDDTASLRQLSLTCSAFRPRARYHLFSGIVIKTVEQLESSGEFLDSHPWLPPLIQRVALRNGTDERPFHLLQVIPVHLFSQLPHLCSWSIVWRTASIFRNWLSLHRLTISCYRKYSVGIQNLELSGLTFMDNILDFTRLISAFTTIRCLTCSDINLRPSKEHNSSFYGSSEMDMLKIAPTPRINHLHIGPDVHINVVEYLLVSGAPTVNSLALTVNSLHQDEDYIDRLAKLASGLSQLLSLTVVIPAHFGRQDVLKAICYTTRILKHVEMARRLSDVRVEFELDSIADLGSLLSIDGPPLEACRALEDALLSFDAPRRVLFRPVRYPRARRVKFWSPTITRAFPRLSNQGLFTYIMRTDTPDPLGHENDVESLIASPDSKWIATASYDGTIIVWNAECGTIVQEWVAHQGHSVNALAFSPDSRRLVSAGSGTTGTLAVWDISNGVYQAAALDGHTGVVITCDWSPDGALIASASKDGTVRVWDAQTFEQCDVFEDAEANRLARPEGLQFSPDASYLAWRHGRPGCCTIWRPLAEEQLTFLSHPSGLDININALSFDPESRRIATAHGNWSGPYEPEVCVVRIWDVATGATLAVLAGHSKRVKDVSFAPDGKFLLSASDDGSTKIWDADAWEETASLEEERLRAGIMKACFSPDGKYIATGSANGTVRLWRTSDASCASVFTEHADPVEHVAFSPDGEFLASGDEYGIVHIRRLSDFIGQ